METVANDYYANNPIANEDENNNGNQRNNNANQGFGFGNSGVMNRGNQFGNNNANRGFRAFGGRGTTVG